MGIHFFIQPQARKKREEKTADKYRGRPSGPNRENHLHQKEIFNSDIGKIVNDDPVNLELHLFNSYDVSWPFIVLLGAFRFVCSNGLVVGKKFMQVRKRHVFGLEKIELENEISTALKRFTKQAEEWQKWTGRLLTENSYNQVMEDMKCGKRAEE